jgi:ribosomal protein S18 acetylase RimI-like enzyme
VAAASVRTLISPSSSEVEALAEIFDRYRAHYGERSDGSPSRGWLEQCMNSGRLRAFVAEDGAKIVGFATTCEIPASLRLAHFWHVRDLFVLPTHRRSGIARVLLASLRAAALDSGAIRLVLQTEEDNRAAIRLYEDSGYTVVRGYCSLMLPLAP